MNSNVTAGAQSEKANSVASSTTKSQVNIKLDANQTKADLKALLKNVDTGKSSKHTSLHTFYFRKDWQNQIRTIFLNARTA